MWDVDVWDVDVDVCALVGLLCLNRSSVVAFRQLWGTLLPPPQGTPLAAKPFQS